jgi:pimeloyl-ACP methyl ester carboxylesterase
MNCNDNARNAPAVIFIHGWTANHQRWRLVKQSLEPDYRVVDYDLRGHGHSEKQPGLEYSFSMHVEDLAGLMDALGIERATLIGHSMGGMIAQQFALAYPKRVERLVLAATSPRTVTGTKSRIGIAVAAFLFRRCFNLMIYVKDNGKKKSPDMFPDVFDPEMRASAESASASLHMIAAMDIRSRLAEIKIPTLVLSAENDETISPELTRELAELIPNAQLRTFSDCGHHLILEQHEKVSAAIREFLSGS